MFPLLQYSSVSFSLGPSPQFSSVAYIWGAGDGGQLGTGTQETSLLPIKFPVSEEVGSLLFFQLVKIKSYYIYKPC